MHIGVFVCFHDISIERSCFRKITILFLGSRSSEHIGITHGPPSARITAYLGGRVKFGRDRDKYSQVIDVTIPYSKRS